MTTPDITETLRQHRNELAQKIHDQLDEIESAAAQGKTAVVSDAVDQLHALADLLADIVIEPDLSSIATRLDHHAVELAEHDDYEGARLVIETAEAFGRRHAQLADHAAESLQNVRTQEVWVGDTFYPAEAVRALNAEEVRAMKFERR